MEQPVQNTITKENYPAFKKEYEKAVSSDEKVFWFEGQQVLTDYAKYLVQYVEKTY